MPVLFRSLLANILTTRRPTIPRLTIIILLAVEIRTVIIKAKIIKIITIRALIIAIDAKMITEATMAVIEIGGVITPKKIRIGIEISNLKGIPAQMKFRRRLVLNLIV